MIELSETLPPTATLVRDTLIIALSDRELQSDLSMEDIMPWWLVSGLADILVELGVSHRQLQVRTCNYPLSEYDLNPNLPEVRYSCTHFLETDGFFFKVGYEGKDCPASGMGLVVVASVQEAVAHQIAQRDRGIHWHTDHAWEGFSNYVHAGTRRRVVAYAAQPLARFQQACLDRQTPPAPSAIKPPRL